MKPLERSSIVILTRNRKAQLLQTLRSLQSLREEWPIIVVDNGSTDGTSAAVGRRFPAVMLIRSRRNIGGAARNIAVAYAHTPYVAFSDDDVCWEAGSLQKAVEFLDQNPELGVLSGVVRHQGSSQAATVATQQIGDIDLSFFALNPEACVVRTRAFYEAGGFWPPMYKDGAEQLLALDLANRGWRMAYSDELVAWRPHIATPRPHQIRRQLRNTIWTAWLRLPMRLACSETNMQLREAWKLRQLPGVIATTLAGLGTVLRHRQVVSPEVANMWADRFHPSTVMKDQVRSHVSPQSMV